MNRVIKFRAKELGSNNWVYGYYAMRSEESPVPETNEWYCEHYILIDKGINGLEEVLIDIKTLSQFTGILDKSNSEIYEGDFLNVGNPKLGYFQNIDGKNVKYEVKFVGCEFILFRNDIQLNWGRLSRIEELNYVCQVNGNIYEAVSV